MNPPSIVKRLVANGLIALGLLVAAGGLLTARMLHKGELELRTAEALSASGNLEEATLHARQAASAFVPGAPHVPAAYARLIAIAQLAEGRGDINTALFAWHAVRSSALSTRSVFIPHQSELATANASIARLSAKQPVPHGAPLQDPEERQQQMHILLARHNQPRLPWIFVLLGGFATLSIGFVHMGWKSFAAQDKLQPSRLAMGAILAVIGTIAWALALWNA